jgi:hypothetical protein
MFDQSAPQQRAQKMSMLVTCLLLCIPVLGQVIGLFTVLPMLMLGIYTQSKHRFLDYGLLILFIVLYSLIPIALLQFFETKGLSWQVGHALSMPPIAMALLGQFAFTYLGLRRLWRFTAT